jgi:hypothetical protein
MPRALEMRLRDFLRRHYRENPNGYLFANRNGNSYSVGKVTEYGLWPVLKRLQIDSAELFGVFGVWSRRFPDTYVLSNQR